MSQHSVYPVKRLTVCGDFPSKIIYTTTITQTEKSAISQFQSNTVHPASSKNPSEHRIGAAFDL